MLYASPDVTAFRNRAVSPKRAENVQGQGNYQGQLSVTSGTLQVRFRAEAGNQYVLEGSRNLAVPT